MDKGFRRRFETTDVELAVAGLKGSYSPHQLCLIGKHNEFHATHAVDGFDGISINTLAYGADVRADTAPFSEYFLLSEVKRGRYWIKSSEGERLLSAGETVALDPYTAYSMDFLDDCEMVQMRIELNAWNRALSDLLGSDDPRHLRFAISKAREPAYEQRCRAILNMMTSEIVPNDWAGHSQLLRNQVIRLCVGVLLDSPLSGPSGQLSSPQAMSRVVREAMHYFEENCQDDVSLSDVAKAVKSSPRGLQNAFQKELGITPMAALREVRMKYAFADLKRCSARQTTVTEIALKWGFANLGRFSTEFRRRFDQHPSDVLRS